MAALLVVDDRRLSWPKQNTAGAPSCMPDVT